MMKRITIMTGVLFFFIGLSVQAQEKKALPKKSKGELVLSEENHARKETGALVRCVSTENEAKLQELYPKRFSTEEFENWLAPKVNAMKQKLAAKQIDGTANVNTVINIPVVVHVIHDGDAVGSGENISLARVQSQITVLNQDYRRETGTPGYNTNAVGADVEIEFCLAQTAPDGSLTNGVDRVNLSGYTWNNSNCENILKPQTIWDPTQYFNIWICEFGGDLSSILGYAQFPSNSGLGGLNTNGGAASTDGVILDWRCFGSSDYVTGNYYSTYDKGRTLTHEIGHCLGLRHIWGDNTTCSVNSTDSGQDYCPDTPAAAGSNFNCTTADSCPSDAGNDMIENYMDYTPDTCMNIFTQDQKTRILAVLANSPRRVELLSSTVCNAPNPEDYDGKVEVNSFEYTICSTTLTPEITLTNLGNNDLTSAVLNYYVDSNTPTTYNWSGSLAYGASEVITMPTISAPDNNQHTYYVTITSVNGTSDMVASNDSSNSTFQIESAIVDVSSVITLDIQLDPWGSETTWQLYDPSGTIVYSGGSYSNGSVTENPFTGTYTFVLSSPVNETFNLSTLGCYTFSIQDSYGDGICPYGTLGYPEGDGYYSLSADGVEFLTGCDYEYGEDVNFKLYDALSTKSFGLDAITLYPNPAGNTLNISVGSNELPENYSIYNTLGQQIMAKAISNEQDLQINTSQFATGVYIIKIASGDESVALQFVKK
ncbi:hypothetical protein NBRC110019_17510 [Neptunitalea chrysea]|uniref:Por secretion system C-terminal sorting domain-containing protein n=1 Tax=Neptunitalea chrysea TaxID=1647581 RepID=A0A9W6B4Q8_9FLAO|nr:M43 family zinc metalloprotease [Neptunitalea chrysea]GLB52711.1 hypothetical protein NBRC110019_17510 [Neptunitalea chrysea]